LVSSASFNHAKTTFVNALLDANVLPVGVTAHHRAESTTVRHGRARGAAGDRGRRSGRSSLRRAGRLRRRQGRRREDAKFLEVSLPSELLRDRSRWWTPPA